MNWNFIASILALLVPYIVLKDIGLNYAILVLSLAVAAQGLHILILEKRLRHILNLEKRLR